MVNLILTAHESDNDYPKRVSVKHEGSKASFAVVHIDGVITFYGSDVDKATVQQLMTISDNFNLFYNNIKTKR